MSYDCAQLQSLNSSDILHSDPPDNRCSRDVYFKAERNHYTQ